MNKFKYDGDFIDSHGEYYVPSWAANLHEKGNLFYDESVLYYYDGIDIYLVPVGSELTHENGKVVITFEGKEMSPLGFIDVSGIKDDFVACGITPIQFDFGQEDGNGKCGCALTAILSKKMGEFTVPNGHYNAAELLGLPSAYVEGFIHGFDGCVSPIINPLTSKGEEDGERAYKKVFKEDKMIIKWKMSIGYPGACQTGEVEIDEKDLEGLTEEDRQEVISQAIWEDAMQYVDVYQVD